MEQAACLLIQFPTCYKIEIRSVVDKSVGFRLKESMMGLRPRQGNLRQVFRLFKSHPRLCLG